MILKKLEQNLKEAPHSFFSPYEAHTNSLPFPRDKITKHVLKETKNAQSEVLSTTQPFYVSRSEESFGPQ